LAVRSRALIPSNRFATVHFGGSKRVRVLARAPVPEPVSDYFIAAGLDPKRREALSQTFGGRGRGFTGKAPRRSDVLKMSKNRCQVAAMPSRDPNLPFRATAITLRHKGDERLQDAQVLVGHADPRTTLVYSRTSEAFDRDEIERVHV
jgi:hypothetical protein